MTQERLKEIAERAAKAPQGPWVTDTFYHRSSTEVCLVLLDAGGIRLADTLNADDQTINQEVDEDSVSFYVSGACTDALEFAAKARTDIPDLVAHIHTLEEQNGRLREALAAINRVSAQPPKGRESGYSGRQRHDINDLAATALSPPAPAKEKL